MKQAILLIFLLACGQVIAQRLVVTKISISELEQEKYDKDVYITHTENGPYVLLHCQIVNSSNHDIRLFPAEASYTLHFNIEGQGYNEEVVPMPFTDRTRIDLKPGKSVNFEVGTYLLHSFISESRPNRDVIVRLLLKALPTLQVHYEQKDLKINSTGAGIVDIKL